MRNLLLIGLAASIAAAVVGCDDEAFEDAVAKRKAKAGIVPSAERAGQPTAKPAPSAVVPALAPVFSEDTLKSYPVLPTVMASEKNPVTAEKITLGRMLFFDPRLSKNHDVSCNSCHGLDTYGVDNEATSPGHKGQRGGRNSPTVYNAGSHVAQFWDGRAADLEEQAKGPVLNPVEMAMPNEARVVKTLSSMPEYREAFKKAFPDAPKALTFDNMAKAIGAFERKLVTPSRFDKWREGDAEALTDQELRGFAAFVKVGCPTCHVGAAIGGTTFQKLGLINPWLDESDLGRMDVTKSEDDKLKFRVPSLRNIEKTAPYFHKGQIKTLEEVVDLMAWHQLGIKLEPAMKNDILAFLKSLTGELPTEYIQPPTLPESTATTPKADPS